MGRSIGRMGSVRREGTAAFAQGRLGRTKEKEEEFDTW